VNLSAARSPWPNHYRAENSKAYLLIANYSPSHHPLLLPRPYIHPTLQHYYSSYRDTTEMSLWATKNWYHPSNTSRVLTVAMNNYLNHFFLFGRNLFWSFAKLLLCSCPCSTWISRIERCVFWYIHLPYIHLPFYLFFFKKTGIIQNFTVQLTPLHPKMITQKGFPDYSRRAPYPAILFSLLRKQ
jgi:hypothetical protein